MTKIMPQLPSHLNVPKEAKYINHTADVFLNRENKADPISPYECNRIHFVNAAGEVLAVQLRTVSVSEKFQPK